MSRTVEQDSRAAMSDARVRTATWPGAANRLRGESIPAVLRQYLPFDWAISVYVMVIGAAVAVWGGAVTNRWKIVVLHLALLMAVFAVVRYLSAARSRAACFIRLLYLPLAITLFYEEMGLLLRLFHSGWFDQQIIALERSILGVSPTLWIQPWQKPLVNELMMLGYFSYYPIVGVPLLILFFKRRDHEVAQLVWAMSLAFFISYLGFIIYPVQGPRFELAGLYERELTGYLFVPLVNAIMGAAAIHGGCMPSSHVAVAMVCLVYALKYERRLGMVCFPLVATLFLGTVAGRFHYVSDVAVGVLVGVFALWVAARYPVKGWMVVPGSQKARPLRVKRI